MSEQAAGTSISNPENLREIERPIASIVLISSDSKILLGQKIKHDGAYSDDDYWHIPGGGIEDEDRVFLSDGTLDEEATLQNTARREAGKEEVVGLNLHGVTLRRIPTGYGESPKVLDSGEKVWCKMTFNRFEARLPETAVELEKHVRPGPEFARIGWFDGEKLARLNQIPGGREFFVEMGYIQEA
jgi:hypothetical protein